MQRQFTLAILALCLCPPSLHSQDRNGQPEHWVTTWTATQQLARLPAPARGGGGPPQAAQARSGSQSSRPDGPIPPSLSNQTIRMAARVSLGGKRVRIRLSNAFGASELTVGSASVAVRLKESEIVPGTAKALTFSGQPSCVIRPGAVMLSDPLDMQIAPRSDLAVSLYFPQDTGLPTSHPLGLHTAYISSGDMTARASMPEPSITSAYLWLSDVEVVSAPNAYTVVAFGDSITDGFRTTRDADRAWPYLLATRLSANKPTAHIAVVNEGFSGNQVLRDGADVSALARFDRDILSHPGVRWVILLEGINDINIRGRTNGAGALTSDELIAGYRQLIERAHLYGIKVLGATLTPEEGVPTASATGEEIRQAANRWIRTGKAFDAIVDFDAVVRDPEHQARMRPEFDPGDHIHPNDAGNQAMADAVNVSIFRK